MHEAHVSQSHGCLPLAILSQRQAKGLVRHGIKVHYQSSRKMLFIWTHKVVQAHGTSIHIQDEPCEETNNDEVEIVFN